MASIGVVIDACVLIKASLRDTLIRAHVAGLYQLRWTIHILDEVERNLIRDGITTPEGATRLSETFQRVLEAAQVHNYEQFIGSMTNDPKDRHVLAAAVASRSEILVTDNVRDFPSAALTGLGMEVQRPDEFLTELFERNPAMMIQIVETQASVLKRPPLTSLQILDNLERDGAPSFATMVRGRLVSTRQ